MTRKYRTTIDGDMDAFKVRREEIMFQVWRVGDSEPSQVWVRPEDAPEHSILRRIGPHMPLNIEVEGTGPHLHFKRRIEPVNEE